METGLFHVHDIAYRYRHCTTVVQGVMLLVWCQYDYQPSANLQKKLQFVECPPETGSSIHLHVKMPNFTAEINMFKHDFI